MILSDVLQCYQSSLNDDIHCSDIYQFKRLHTFLREAILDRHIPLYKIIGVSYLRGDTSIKRSRRFVNIEGTDSVGESYPELMLNLQDKIFLPGSIDHVPTKSLSVYNCTLPTGSNAAGATIFTDTATGEPVNFIYTKDKICTVMNDAVTMQVTVYYSCGFIDMGDTSKLLAKNIFPFYVDYSLQDYVRILPPSRDGDDTTVHVRYYNGMTKEVFLNILSDWEKALKCIQFGLEESLWLQRSEH